MRFWKRKRTLGENKGNLNKHELWLTIMYRYWFTKCNKCIILMKDVTNGMGKMATLYLLCNISANLKFF